MLGMTKAASAEEITQYESVEKKYLRMGDMKQNTQREREREAQRISLLAKCNIYNNEQPTFTKGYKVTLYSDSLRATALYAIYINGPNLGYPRG